MADRIFGSITLAIALVYGYIAFTIIKAPFQYDPLGPETWPQILSVAAGLCCVYIIIRPDHYKFKALGNNALVRIGVIIALVSAYAYLFEPLGFIVATALFCGVLSRLLGAKSLQAGLFGAVSGIAGYGLCAGLLELNLPFGVVFKTLRGML